jgi:ATPase subunit of ABC transporter with duplicated ATPase domains
MSAQLLARHISVSLGPLQVLRDVSVTVGRRARIGVLGPNGVGKSTLLRTLAGLVLPDEGAVERAPVDAVVGYLEQEPLGGTRRPLLALLEHLTGVSAAREEMARLRSSMGNDLAAIGRFTDAVARFDALGGYDLTSRAADVIADLGLPEDAMHRPVASLSGGQRAKAALAAIVLSRADILLLDEPTNDLDLDGLSRLESFVTGFSGGIMMVSHDRAFLDAAVDTFIEIDPFTHEASEFHGSWSDYERARELRRQHQRQEHERTTAERERLLAQARAMRAQAAHGVATVKKSGEPSKAIVFAKTQRAQRRGAKGVTLQRRAQRVDVAEKPREPWTLHLDLAPGVLGGEQIAALSGAVIERDTFRLGPIDLEVRRGEHIAVTGPNGSGKSTLLGALLGDVRLTHGTRTIGPSSVLGALRQDRLEFATDTSLLSSFEEITGLRGGHARTLLAKFDLGADDVGRPGRELSPGERTRASLAVLMAARVNCLVLDEPTNHLDIPAIEQLERSLAVFPGAFVLATHDRRLLARVGIAREIRVG